MLIAMSLLLITGSLWLMSEPAPGTIVVTFPNGAELVTEVADTPQRIFIGLAFREQLPKNSGMLYIFDTSDLHRVKTLGYMFPVDMISLDDSRYSVHVVEYAELCPKEEPENPCPFFGPPPEDARYVIQTAAGIVRAEGVKTDTELKFALRM